MRRLPGLRQAAFSLVELLTVVVVIGALAAIAIPSYQSYIERTKRSQAMQDIHVLSLAIEQYYIANAGYPPNLAALGGNLPLTDPWGNAYRYLGINVKPPPSTGEVRRDKNLNPLNSDYDLYSMGPDGLTQKQLTAAKARDDIVRAGNGGFIGTAADH